LPAVSQQQCRTGAGKPGLPWWLVACYYGGLEWGCDSLRPYPFPARQRLCRRRAWALACAVLSAAAVGAVARAYSPLLEATFLAVGQGDAIYLQVPGWRHILIDAGPGRGQLGGASAAERVVVPFLRWKGVRALDLVLLTHAHADHAGGLRWVAERAVIRRLGVPEGLLEGEDALRREVEELQRRGRVQALVRLQAGDCWQLGRGLRLEVLSPLPGLAGGADPNASALAVRVVYRRASLLCLSDLPAAVQERLVAQKGAGLRAELLKAPHHGSRDAWYQPLWEAAGPRWAVISVGRNAFGHPHGKVVEALRALGVAVLRTDQAGAVTAVTVGGRWWIRTFVH
ncbi:MAG: MBL fold metallo-hydrolase, partial [Bacillota bacterium]|nr:MBL fold metallo-hydrolase [Bacillota bacterium]